MGSFLLFAFCLGKQKFLKHCNLICTTSWMGGSLFVSLLSVSGETQVIHRESHQNAMCRDIL